MSNQTSPVATMGDTKPLKIEAGRYYRTRDGRKVGPMKQSGVDGWPWIVNSGDGDAWMNDGMPARNTSAPALIAEWANDTPHIIQSTNGRTYDLTALETPFGLLPEDVQEALRNWPRGLTQYTDCGETGWRDHVMHKVSYHTRVVYRAKPAPKVTEHVLLGCLTGHCVFTTYPGDFDTHSFTIRHTGDTLPAGTYTGPDGAEIVVEALK